MESKDAAPQPRPKPAIVPSPRNEQQEALKAEIRALEVQRAELLVKYAPAHPDVRALERKLQLRRKQLAELAPHGGL